MMYKANQKVLESVVSVRLEGQRPLEARGSGSESGGSSATFKPMVLTPSQHRAMRFARVVR